MVGFNLTMETTKNIIGLLAVSKTLLVNPAKDSQQNIKKKHFT